MIGDFCPNKKKVREAVQTIRDYVMHSSVTPVLAISTMSLMRKLIKDLENEHNKTIR